MMDALPIVAAVAFGFLFGCILTAAVMLSRDSD
jgi:hypothetical protein